MSEKLKDAIPVFCTATIPRQVSQLSATQSVLTRIFRIATLTVQQTLEEFITLSHGVPEFDEDEGPGMYARRSNCYPVIGL
jgi:hypothetical protein